MTIHFHCTNCQRELAAEDRVAGTESPCPGCGMTVRVPEVGGEASVAEDEPVEFKVSRDSEDELDMTPMVDVVFLLLIFFMVTAAFSLQKSLEVPAPDQQESANQARTIEDFETDDDYVIVRVARDNTVWVDEREAPSKQEVASQLREARQGWSGGNGRGPTRLLVLADREARHETVIMVLDAGNAVGMESVRLATVDEEDF